MNREIQIIRVVALQADAFRDRSEELGNAAADAIGGDAGSRQIKGLENVANSALKVSDVLDYLKRQTAKCRPGTSWRKNNLGSSVLEILSSDLVQRGAAIGVSLEATDVERQRIQLMLIREFVHQLAAHYAFASSGAGQN